MRQTIQKSFQSPVSRGMRPNRRRPHTRASTRPRRAQCKRQSTLVFATLWSALALIFALGCGGKAKGGTNNYARAIDRQEACCRELADAAAQEACIARIVRVDDAEVQGSKLNQSTYACFLRHFVCDPMTGAVSKEASQKQYDCIDELDE